MCYFGSALDPKYGPEGKPAKPPPGRLRAHLLKTGALLAASSAALSFLAPVGYA